MIKIIQQNETKSFDNKYFILITFNILKDNNRIGFVTLRVFDILLYEQDNQHYLIYWFLLKTKHNLTKEIIENNENEVLVIEELKKK